MTEPLRSLGHLLLAVLLSSGLQAMLRSTLEDRSTVVTNTCNYELITSFGFKGLTAPSDYKMRMCPNIGQSCCRMSDQQVIYDSWEVNYERIDLEERLEAYEKLYTAILDTAQDIEIRAEYLMTKLKKKALSNCRILATKVVEYKIRHVSEVLKKEMEDINEFLLTSYRGFYCALCDASLQAAFNVRGSAINFSRKFCRQMTSKSFHFLMYFHVHMIKYLNLLMRFLTYCDGRGKFSNRSIDPDLLLRIDTHLQTKLEGCRDHRNLPDWMEYCHFVCDSFNIIVFPEMFAPQYGKYVSTLGVLRNLIRKFELPPAEPEDLEADTDGTFKMIPHKKTIKRLKKKKKQSGGKTAQPATAKPANPQATEDLEPEFRTKFGSQFVIKSQGITSFNVESFANKFVFRSSVGINPYDVGKYTQITDDKFQVVKQEAEREVVVRTSTGFKVSYPVVDESARLFEEQMALAKAQQAAAAALKAGFRPNPPRSLNHVFVAALGLSWLLLSLHHL